MARQTASAGATTKSRSSRNPTSGNDTPNTPEVKESEIARLKVDELRRRLKDRGVKGTAELKKPELVKRLVKEYTGAGKKSTSAKAGGKTGAKVRAKGGAGKKGSTLRTGKGTSGSLKYSQEIRSVDDKPERAGRSLVTTDHEVIRRWAEARKAVPATVEGTGPGDTLGVLRFDFPGYGGESLTHIEWDEWFDTFDRRRLNFIYQQTLSDGGRSNFFQLESPDQ